MGERSVSPSLRRAPGPAKPLGVPHLVERLRDLDKPLLGKWASKHKVRKGEGVIYLIVSPSDKGYVGQSVDPLRRMGNHRRSAESGEPYKRPMVARSIACYGWDAMVVKVLWHGCAVEMDDKEVHWIAELDTFNNGMNMTTGGQNGQTVSEEVREKNRVQKKKEWAENREVMERCNGPAAMAKRQATLGAKTQERLSELGGKAREKAERRVVDGRKKTAKDLAKRQAGRDPEAWAAWQADEARMTTDERKSLRMAQKRAEKMAGMGTVEAALWMHRVRRSAMHMANKRGVAFETLERWYPNVLTMAEIRALERNGGTWDVPPASSASKATSGKGQYESSDEE